MGLIRKKNSQPTHAELLLQKIFEGDAERGEQFEQFEQHEQQPTQQPPQPERALTLSQSEQPITTSHQPPTEGWMQTGEAEVPFFVDEAGRMWVGTFLEGGGERWSRHKSGDRGAR